MDPISEATLFRLVRGEKTTPGAPVVFLSRPMSAPVTCHLFPPGEPGDPVPSHGAADGLPGAADANAAARCGQTGGELASTAPFSVALRHSQLLLG